MKRILNTIKNCWSWWTDLMEPFNSAMYVAMCALLIWIACAAGAALALARMLWCAFTNQQKALAIAAAIDRAANVAGNGDNRETVSSRANRARAEGRAWGCILCRVLDTIQANHCRDSAGK